MSGYQTVDASPISMRKWEEKLGPRSSFPSYAIRDVMDELFCFSLFMKNLAGIIVVEFRCSAFHGLYSFYENCIAKVLLSGKPGQLRSSNWTHFLVFFCPAKVDSLLEGFLISPFGSPLHQNGKREKCLWKPAVRRFRVKWSPPPFKKRYSLSYIKCTWNKVVQIHNKPHFEKMKYRKSVLLFSFFQRNVYDSRWFPSLLNCSVKRKTDVRKEISVFKRLCPPFSSSSSSLILSRMSSSFTTKASVTTILLAFLSLLVVSPFPKKPSTIPFPCWKREAEKGDEQQQNEEGTIRIVQRSFKEQGWRPKLCWNSHVSALRDQ